MSDTVSRWDYLKGTGIALGGLAVGGMLGGVGPFSPGVARAADPSDPTQRYTHFQNLDPISPNTLAAYVAETSLA
jgi:hypothetical protein